MSSQVSALPGRWLSLPPRAPQRHPRTPPKSLEMAQSQECSHAQGTQCPDGDRTSRWAELISLMHEPISGVGADGSLQGLRHLGTACQAGCRISLSRRRLDAWSRGVSSPISGRRRPVGAEALRRLGANELTFLDILLAGGDQGPSTTCRSHAERMLSARGRRECSLADIDRLLTR